MLVSDIISPIRSLVGDVDTTRWSDTTLISLVDEAQKMITRSSKILKTSTSIVVHSDQSTYSIVDNAYIITRALYNGTYLTLKTHEELDAMSNTWENDKGEPKFLVYDKLAPGLVKISPVPEFEEPIVFDLSTANILEVYCIKTSDTINALTDELEIPEIYVPLFKYYVTAQLFRFDLDTQNRAFGNEQLILFGQELQALKIEVSKNFARGEYTANYRKGI